MTARAARSWWHSPAITGSAAIASLLSLVLFPVLTRLYSPSEIGRYGLFIAAVSVLGAVLTARYDMAALATPHDAHGDAEAVSLCRLSLLVSVAGTLLVALVVVPLVALGVLGTQMYWLPLGAFGTAVVGLQVTLDSRSRRYGVASALAVIRVLVFVGAAVVLSSLSRSAAALCAAAVVATIPSAVRALVLLRGSPQPMGAPLQLATKHRDFPLFQTPAALLNAAPMLVLTMWVDRVAGAVILGFVVAAARIQMAPVNALSSAVSSVLTTDVVAEARAAGPIQRRYVRALLTTGALTLASGLFAVLITPWLQLLLGPQWDGLRPYLIALLPLALAFMVAGIPTAVLSVVGQQPLVLASRVWLLVALAAGFLLASAIVPPGAGMVGAGSVIYLVACMAFAVFTHRRLGAVLGPEPAMQGGG